MGGKPETHDVAVSHTKPWAAGWLIDEPPRDGRRFLAAYPDGTVAILHSQLVDDANYIRGTPSVWRELPRTHDEV